MNKPIIAVDVDDTLAAEAEFMIRYSNEHWGHTLTIADYHENWTGMWGVDHEEGERRALVLHQPGIVTQYRLLEQAVEVLRELAKDFELVILTSRRASVKDETLEWLRQNFGDIFSDIRFTGFFDAGKPGGHLHTKGELVKGMGAQYLIDDQPKHCFAAASEGVTALLFGDYVDRTGLELPEDVTVCKDWAAVLDYFKVKSGI